NVACDQCDAGAHCVEVVGAAGAEVAQHAYGVAALDEGLHEVRADEAGAAGDEAGGHGRRPLKPSFSPLPWGRGAGGEGVKVGLWRLAAPPPPPPPPPPPRGGGGGGHPLPHTA